ncbi:MAG TPA: isoprenyl transferase [Candidatus Gastranaerophilales bacterium]|nr:isoprenyl transferase [Candidatus Gastranaerophilales bacterium]
MTINIILADHSTEQAVLDTGLKHIAIIMDGNRRWSTKKHLPSMVGHKEGVNALQRAIKAADKFNVKYLTVYAFSTENWGRKHDEVEFLMKLLKETVQNKLKALHKNNVKIRIIGDTAPLSSDLKTVLEETEELTQENTGLNLQIAINYGSRNEITSAVRKICEDVKTGIIADSEEITDKLIENYLYTAGIPDPDLLIRTGGEQRISNYLLWQLAYTEIYITETFWPDFDENTLGEAIQIFANRNRRYGKD